MVSQLVLVSNHCYHRRCPGIFFAEASIFATVAQTLAIYTISKATDTNGDVIEPRVGTSGTNLRYVASCLVLAMRALIPSTSVTPCRSSAS